jgi:hypothetical protein
MPFSLRWLDFSRCTWPEWLVSEPEFRTLQGGGRRLARAFASLNDPFIPALASACKHGATVITFSHFVPRPDVSIEKRFLIEPMLTKVIGSCELESQIRCIKPQLHLVSSLLRHLLIIFLLERFISFTLSSSGTRTFRSMWNSRASATCSGLWDTSARERCSANPCAGKHAGYEVNHMSALICTVF